jgi:hypothetical protein
LTETTSRYAAIGLGLAGAVLLAVLLVQNVLQARSIASLETRVADLQTQVAAGRRAAAAAGAPVQRRTPAERAAKAGKGRGKGKARGERLPQRGDRVARDPLAEGARGGGKAGKRRAAPTDEAYE